jgi:ribose transport system ATP-binding protein
MTGITKAYPGVRALDGVDFELQSGEVHILLGENGAGKSTLMKVLSGACRPDGGTIRIDGRPVEIRTPQQARALGINTIYQEFTLVPQLSVAANLFLGREPGPGLGWVNRRMMRQRAAQVLRDLGVPLDPSLPVRALGVAQQQMVEVARALAFDARILIMDEPTSALAPAEIETLFGLIRRVRAQGVGVIYISHRMEEIFALGDRVTVLRDGRLVATHPVAEVTVDRLIRLMANREVPDHYPRRPVVPGEPLLEVAGLGTRDKLRDVSFTLRQGEILGVAGLLGSGRTTLARALFGAEPVTAGRIVRRGQVVRVPSARAAVAQGLGLLPEDRKRDGLVLGLSVERNLGLASPGTVFPGGWLSARASKKLAEQQVDQLRIKTAGLEQRAGHLSGGNQQKVVLGKWLACGADVLIFDEPTRGIDVAAKVDIYELMNHLTASGAAILMISSDLPEVLGMSDRILVMRSGRLVREFGRGEADQGQVLAAAFGETA